MKYKGISINGVTGSVSKIINPYNIVYTFLILLVYKTMFVDFLPSLSAEFKQQINAINMNVDFKYRTTDMPQLAVKAEFLRNQTVEDSVIVNPPQSWDYSDIGNQVLMRYFLFPRKLVSYSKLDKFILDNKGAECKLYSIVSRGYVDKTSYFPDSDLLSIKTLSLLKTDGSVVEYYNLNNKQLKELILSEDVIIGVLENKKCISF